MEGLLISCVGGIIAGGLAIWTLCRLIYGARAQLAESQREFAIGERNKAIEEMALAVKERDTWKAFSADLQNRLNEVVERLRNELEWKQQKEVEDARKSPDAALTFLGRALQNAADKGRADESSPTIVRAEGTAPGGTLDPSRRKG